MKPGTGGNHVWSTYEYLKVQLMSIFPRTREGNWTRRAESASCSDMEVCGKDIKFLILSLRRSRTAEMSSSINKRMDLVGTKAS